MYTRPPAVAGQFYPSDPMDLRRMIGGYLGIQEAGSQVPKALIAPHAGYVYSGAVAGSAYACLADARARIRRVVLLGPGHRVYVPGLALPRAQHFATPLGEVALDPGATQKLAVFPQVSVMDHAHACEHSIEVQIPFLQMVLEQFTIVPLVVGGAAPEDVSAVIEALWEEAETLIVVSSDLSHYHDYETAREIDRATAAAIVRGTATLHPEQACGCAPINGLLHFARKHKLRIAALDVRNSGDTAGPRDRVVGYGAFALYSPSESLPLCPEDRHLLLDAASRSIARGFEHVPDTAINGADYPQRLRVHQASFVTLKTRGQLRGCIGSLERHRPLVMDVAENARAAAFGDPRFRPLIPEECASLAIHISVLNAPVALNFKSDTEILDQLAPGADGVLLQQQDRRATFLPAVWESLPGRAEFLRELKRKAGISQDADPETLQVWRYTVESFSTMYHAP
ncbi:MAG: AmmeMemoRadiSam system protein B [Pseudomonadota bacterium]|nr:AmmeMemoRadiSam system protein B [Pseudomonadota bacterium]